MNHPFLDGQISPTELSKIDEACLEFERMLGEEKKVSIEDFLLNFASNHYEIALRELLWIEWEHLRSRHTIPEIDAYLNRFATTETKIREYWEQDKQRHSLQKHYCETDSLETRYETLFPYAEGGLGRIVVAHDRQLNRRVAIKEIHAHLEPLSTLHQRFLQEAWITSQLEHPGIVPVHSMGTSQEGTPYFAMRLMEGQTFQAAISVFHADAIDKQPFTNHPRTNGYTSPRFYELLNHFCFVCQVIQFAHSKGVIHRDIKPSNIILGSHGETTVIDWGLSKLITDPEATIEVSIPTNHSRAFPDTHFGEIIGTPGFMSPEQSSGKNPGVDTRSDVYSLGATLHYLLYGTISSDDSDSCGENTVQKPNLRRTPPEALRAIARKAMNDDPAQRYQTPDELRVDLQNWLALRPVSIYREPLPERVYRRFKQNPSAAVVAILAIFLLTLIASSSAVLLAFKNAKLAHASSELEKKKNELVESNNAKASVIRQLSENNQKLYATKEELTGIQISILDSLEKLNAFEKTTTFSHIIHVLEELASDTANRIAGSKNDVNNKESIAKLTSILLAFGKPESAIEMIDTTIETQKQSGLKKTAHAYAKALTLIALQRPDDAKPLLKEVLDNPESNDEEKANAILALTDLALKSNQPITAALHIKRDLPWIRTVFVNNELKLRKCDKLEIAYLISRNEYKKAVALLKPLEQKFEQSDKPETLEVIDLFIVLATAYYNAGNQAAALEILEKSINKLEKIVSHEHPTYIAAASLLGTGYAGIGDYDKAIQLHRECVSLAQNSRQNPTLFYACQAEVIADLIQTREYSNALALVQATLQNATEELGDTHPLTYRLKTQLAGCWTYTDQTQLSTPLLEDCLDYYDSRYGERHKDVLEVKTLIGLAYESEKKYDKMTKVITEIFEQTKEIYGVDHPLTCMKRDNLAVSLTNAERFAEALPHAKESYEIELKRDNGNTNPGLVLSTTRYAYITGCVNQPEQAEALFIDALRGTFETLDSEHIYARNLFFELNQWTRRRPEESDRAVRVLRTVVDMPEFTLRRHNLLRIDAMMNIADIQRNTEQIDEALRQIDTTLEYAKAQFPEDASLSDKITSFRQETATMKQ